MEIILNSSYGGFMVTQEIADMFHTNVYDTSLRENKELINIIKNGKQDVSGSFSKLEVFEIPDEVTDYTITDYDGIENIIYVQDGKLYDENNCRIGNRI